MTDYDLRHSYTMLVNVSKSISSNCQPMWSLLQNSCFYAFLNNTVEIVHWLWEYFKFWLCSDSIWTGSQTNNYLRVTNYHVGASLIFGLKKFKRLSVSICIFFFRNYVWGMFQKSCFLFILTEIKIDRENRTTLFNRTRIKPQNPIFTQLPWLAMHFLGALNYVNGQQCRAIWNVVCHTHYQTA